MQGRRNLIPLAALVFLAVAGENPFALRQIDAVGCLAVRRDFAQEHKDALDAFLEDYQSSVEFVNANPKEAAAISGEMDLIPAAVAEKAIPECNIVYLDGADMKEKLPGFLQILFDANPKSVGGAMPEDDFYYEK